MGTTVCILFIMILINSCIGRKTYYLQKEGKVANSTSVFDSISNNYVKNPVRLPDNSFLFREKFVIAAVPGVYLDWDYNGHFDSSAIMFYVFIDLEKMLFFKYHSLSDSATAFQIYNLKQADTVHWGINWRFYESNKFYSKGFKQTKLNDTLIHNHIYKQNRIINHTGLDSLKYTSTTFLSDCSVKDTRFQIVKNMDTLTGCPVTKIVVTGYPYNHINMMGEIIFERNYLTDEEKEVFRAWEQNAKKYEKTLLKQN